MSIQKQLGIAIGFSESCADIRIAQYESGDRTPKEATIKKLAKELAFRLKYSLLQYYRSQKNTLPLRFGYMN